MTPEEILHRASFDWVTQLDDVWAGIARPEHFVHQESLHPLVEQLDSMAPQAASPLGRVVTGPAGSGKTHFVRHLRAAVQERDGFFFLVDCTDIRDFWATVSLGIVRGLLQEQLAHEGLTQAAFLRYRMTIDRGVSPEAARRDIRAEHSSSELNRRARAALDGLPRNLGGGLPLSPVLSTLFYLDSHDALVRESASMWMQGAPIDDDMRQELGLPTAAANPSELLRALTSVLSLFGPTVIAFDQLDALISQHHFQQREPGEEETEAGRRAGAILQSVGAGLMGLFDGTTRALTVLSCLHESWGVLQERMGNAAQARFQPNPIALEPSPDPDRVRTILRSRLEAAAEGDREGVEAALEAFGEAFFARYAAFTPREILRAAEETREQSRLPPDANGLDERFESLRAGADVEAVLTEEGEDDLGRELRMAFPLLRHELEIPANIDFAVDADFAGGRNYPTLHARLRLIFREEGDREYHICLRVLQKTHHSAFRARLNAAMVEAGIDRELPYRKLLLLRNTPLHFGGPQTLETIEAFRDRGGTFPSFEKTDVAAVKALLELKEEAPEGFESWLAERKPLSGCPSWKPIVDLLREEMNAGPDSGADAPRPKPSPANTMTLGYRTDDGADEEPVGVSLDSLTKHVVIRAGSGGGKTVLIKRLIEEAALRGVSSVVLDPGNDLAHLANDWEHPHPGWRDGDAKRCEDLRRRAEVVVHTPGRSDGRPMFLPFLPDLSSMADQEDDLNAAVASAEDRLATHVAPGNSASAHNKRGILALALRNLARKEGPLTLARLADYLEALPPESDPGVQRADKLAADMSDALRALLARNPDLDRTDHLADWAELFGIESERTQISVINFCGIRELTDQQEFVNRLAESLFAWARENPSCGPAGITGLFVIDEAKDFLPSQKKTPCKAALMRLAAQARKYGVALVVATQNPKDLDYNAVAQFSTQYFGRANMPQVIDFIREQLTEKGAPDANPSQLDKGEFYLATEGAQAPARVASPMCLTYHPDGRPLTQAEVLSLAKG